MQRSRSRANGFTLIEVIVVFIIIAAAAGLALPAFRNMLDEDDLELATRKVEALMRIARDSALSSGRRVTVLVDSVSTLVWLDSPPLEPLDDPMAPTGVGTVSSISGLSSSTTIGGSTSRTTMTVASAGWGGQGDIVEPGTDLELPNSVRLEIASARARFTFEPTGAAFADTIYLSTSSAARMITIEPWTGDVIVVR